MKYERTYNFSAGPAMMPEAVLEEIRDEMMNYRGSGMCVMEMSHRSKEFQQIVDEAIHRRGAGGLCKEAQASAYRSDSGRSGCAVHWYGYDERRYETSASVSDVH